MITARAATAKFNRNSVRATAATKAKMKFRVKAALFLISAFVVSAALASAVGAVRRAAARNNFFVVKEIRITGTKQVEEQRLRGLLNVALSGNIFTRDIQKVTALMEKLPVVETASIRLKLPDVAEVTIVERKPVASVSVAGKMFLMDASRRIIGPAPQGWLGGPTIVGCNCAGAPGDWLTDARLDRAMEVASLFALDSYWHEKAATLDISDASRITAVTTSGLFVRFGPDRAEWREKFYEYMSARRISANMGARFAGYDLSFEKQVVGVGAEGSFAKNQTNKNKG